MATQQVKTKEEFQEKMRSLEAIHKSPKKDSKYKVHPNLTPRGRDILMRLQNKSLDTTGERSYTMDENIVNARLMGKHELIHASKKNAEKIEGLKRDLETKSKLPNKPNHNDKKEEGSGDPK